MSSEPVTIRATRWIYSFFYTFPLVLAGKAV